MRRSLSMLGIALSVLAGAKCKSVQPSSGKLAAGEFETLPAFDVNAWQGMKSGTALAPYNLQSELYRIEVSAATVIDKEKTPVDVRIFDAQGKVLHEFKATMNVRGSSSASFPKKQYSLKLEKDKAQGLLGMAPANSYIVSAPYNDKSLLRDAFIFNASNLIGRYAPRTRFARGQMVIGGERAEMGIWVLTEKNEIGAGKVDIEKSNDQGGTAYLLVVDRVKDGDKAIWTEKGAGIVIDHPGASKLTPEREQFLKGVFARLERSLVDKKSNDWLKLFDEQVDVNAAVDFFLLEELGRNIDGYRLSSPLHIPIGGKLTFGPIWDFNLAFGNADYENGFLWTGWRAAEKGVYFSQLIQHPVFCQAMKSRWTDFRQSGKLSNATFFNIIDKHVAVMGSHADENFRIWGGLGEKLWPNAWVLNTYEREVSAFKSYLALRAQWMDEEIARRDCNTWVNTWDTHVWTSMSDGRIEL